MAAAAQRLAAALAPGALTRAKAALVSNRPLARVAARSGLAGHLVVGLQAVRRLVRSYTASAAAVDTVSAGDAPSAEAGGAPLGSLGPCGTGQAEGANGSRGTAAACFKGQGSGKEGDEGDREGPKLVADVVEAVLGAVALDSGGDMCQVWGAFVAMVRAAGLQREMLPWL